MKKSKLQSWKNFGYKLDSNYWQANKVFSQILIHQRPKWSLTQQCGVILDRWKEYFEDVLNPVTITSSNTQELQLEEKTE